MKKLTPIYKKPWFLLVVITLILLTPILFTQIYSGIEFGNPAEIGDTIGGITAPFINIGAAILVYLSFNEQIKANDLLSKESSYNYIKLLNEDTIKKKEIFESNCKSILGKYVDDPLMEMHGKSHEVALKIAERSEINNYNLAQEIPVLIIKNFSIILTYKTFFSELKGSKISKNLKNNYAHDFLLGIGDFEKPINTDMRHLSNFTPQEVSKTYIEENKKTKDQLILLEEHLNKEYLFEGYL